MLAPQTSVRAGGWRRVVTLLTAIGSTGLLACEDDVGTCCMAFDDATRAKIPVPDAMGGDRIRQDPRFDCSGLTCISTAGSPTYCSRPCREANDCPNGYSCEAVLQSDPGPGAMIGPEDLFCVTTAPECQMTGAAP